MYYYSVWQRKYSNKLKYTRIQRQLTFRQSNQFNRQYFKYHCEAIRTTCSNIQHTNIWFLFVRIIHTDGKFGGFVAFHCVSHAMLSSNHIFYWYLKWNGRQLIIFEDKSNHSRHTLKPTKLTSNRYTKLVENRRLQLKKQSTSSHTKSLYYRLWFRMLAKSKSWSIQCQLSAY